MMDLSWVFGVMLLTNAGTVELEWDLSMAIEIWY